MGGNGTDPFSKGFLPLSQSGLIAFCKLTTHCSLKWLLLNRSCPIVFSSCYSQKRLLRIRRRFAAHSFAHIRSAETKCPALRVAWFPSSLIKKGIVLVLFSDNSLHFCIYKRTVSSAISAPGLSDHSMIFFFQFGYKGIIIAL